MLSDKQVLYQAQLLEHLPAAVLTTNARLHILSWNSGAERLYGWQAEEVIGRNISDVLPDLYTDSFISSMEETGYWNGTVAQPHKQGRQVVVETSIKLICNEAGELLGTLTVTTNQTRVNQPEADIISLQTQAEQAKQPAVSTSARHTDIELEHITNALPILIAYIDSQEYYRYVSQNYETWFGIPTSYMLGKTLYEVAGEVFYEKHKPYYKKALSGETVEFYEQSVRQGNTCFLHILLLPLVNQATVKGFYVLAQDQTALLTAQKALEESNQLYKAITQNFPKGSIFLLDHTCHILFAEGGGMHERGIRPEAFVGKHVSVFFEHTQQWEHHYGRFTQVLQGETVTFTDCVLGQHYEFTGAPLPEKDGRILRILCIIRNITERVKLQEEVKQYTANLQEAQQLAKLGFWEYYPGDQTLVWSDRMYEIFDRPTHEPVPPVSFLKELISTHEWTSIQKHAEQAHRQRRDFKITLPFDLPSGKRKHVQLYARPLEYVGTTAHRLFGAAMDITEQVELEQKVREQDARMKSLFDSATVGIIYWETNGKITQANEYFLKLLGYTRQEVEAGLLSWKTLTPAQWPEDETSVHMLLADSTTLTKEKEMNHKSGKQIPVLLGSAFLAGFQDKGASFVLDISELQTIRKELEKKAQELKDSNSELEKFAYVAAHDLQEPLNTLAGLINLLQYQPGVSTDKEIRKLLDFIPGVIGRMQQLIKTLLEYSKAGSAKIAITEFSMTDVVTEVLNSLAKRIEDTHTTIDYQNLPVIQADQPQMTQLMQNLIGNAIKFRNHRPMHIVVGCQSAPDGWTFSVQDTGIGMEMIHAVKIFGPFQRLHTRKEYEGTGLGLAICQKIVERHGGKIWVESQPGVGSTFFFSIRKLH